MSDWLRVMWHCLWHFHPPCKIEPLIGGPFYFCECGYNSHRVPSWIYEMWTRERNRRAGSRGDGA